MHFLCSANQTPLLLLASFHKGSHRDRKVAPTRNRYKKAAREMKMQAEMLKAHGAAYTPTPSWSHDPMDTGDGVSSPAKKRKTATGAPRGRSGRNMPADYGSPPPAARTRSRSRNREIDPDIIAQAEAYAKRAYEQGKQEMAQAHSREQQTLRQQEETLRQQQEYLVRMREELEQQ